MFSGDIWGIFFEEPYSSWILQQFLYPKIETSKTEITISLELSLNYSFVACLCIYICEIYKNIFKTVRISLNLFSVFLQVH